MSIRTVFFSAFFCTALLVAGAGVTQAAPIHDAARKGDVAQVQRLLKSGVNVESWEKFPSEETEGEETPLIIASYEGHAEVVKLLLAAGAGPNTEAQVRKCVGLTPLRYASKNGHVEVVKLLLAAGADVNTEGGCFFTEGQTALMDACRGGHTEVVRLLLAAGANTKIEDQDGFTPLDWAKEKKYRDIVKLFEDAQKR